MRRETRSEISELYGVGGSHTWLTAEELGEFFIQSTGTDMFLAFEMPYNLTQAWWKIFKRIWMEGDTHISLSDSVVAWEILRRVSDRRT